MIVLEFISSCQLYEGFEVWEIENLTAFLKGNEVLATIFQDDYNVSIEEIGEKRSGIAESDYEIINKLLGLVDDKYFFIFTLHDRNHLDLIGMQHMKIMDFGIDIEKIREDCVYAIIMDKRSS
ncbi:MAG: hypothetical protein KF860_10825 [Cyclobacteriaceae bacterium]|nr:hypothetical protein [Cyclobacteriaceae bacterium]